MARRKRLLEVAQEERTCVLYEAPHRLYVTLQELLQVGDPTGKLGLAQRSILICRELTKLHEEFFRGSINSALDYLSKGKGTSRVKGEYISMCHPRLFELHNTPICIVTLTPIFT